MKTTFPRFWHLEGTPFIANLIPKCACTSLAQLLFYLGNGRFYDEPGQDIHLDDLSSYGIARTHNLTSGDLSNKVILQTVRNPFTRVLSAYLDKMIPRLDSSGWFESYRDRDFGYWKNRFQFGSVYREKQLGEFQNFVKFLAFVHFSGNRDLEDPHFLPFSPKLVELPQFKIDHGPDIYTFRVESFEEDFRKCFRLPELCDSQIPKEAFPWFNKNTTTPSFHKAYYFRSDEIVKLVHRLYWQDFEAGYSWNPSDINWED